MVAYSGKKHRKKPLTFAIPIEASPLSKDDGHEFYDESSDPGMGDAPTGGYRAVPSDTDTSAVDSDPNAMDGRHKRLGRRKKNFKNHDEAWFAANDTKCWTRFRFLCFWGSIVCMFAACVLAGVLIFLMPRNCDPDLEWYQGNVIMDVRPRNLDDLKNLDLKSFKELGVKTLHLKLGYPNLKAQRTETEIDQIRRFFQRVHATNLTIIIQVPVVSENSTTLDMELEHQVDYAIQFWIESGADGIFLDGLESFDVNIWVARKISYWHGLLDRYAINETLSKILMTSYKFAKDLTEKVSEEDASEALAKISLLDANLDLDLKTNITHLEADMERITRWDTIKSRPWINWNLDTSTYPLNNAAVALQMLLPGTINLKEAVAENQNALQNMTSLRALAVPIYMNGNYKRCDCDEGLTKEVNYVISQPLEETIQLERFYNRRNRFVLVANFGGEDVNLGPVGQIYAGGELVLDTSKRLPVNNGEVVKFSLIELAPGEAIVIKLPK